MKVFLFRFNKSFHIEVARQLQRQGVEIAYWSASKRYFETVATERLEFPRTIFHTTFDATLGKPAPGIQTDFFPPLNEQFIKEMLSCESQVLTMMNGIDYSHSSIIQKKRLYYEYLKYWYGIFTTLRPDAAFFGDTPHIAYQFVAYRVAQKLGIKVVLCRVLQITGRVIFLTDHEAYSEVLQGLKKLANDHKRVSDLSEDVRLYYEKQINPNIDVSPFYMKKKYISALEQSSHILPRPGIITKHLLHGTFLKVVKAYIQNLFSKRKIPSIDGAIYSGFALKIKKAQWKRIKKNFRKEYITYQQTVDWSKKFVYVALHNQPECSTSAMGGIFVDQMLMIDLLSAALPEGWVIYVKESPVQWVGPYAHLGRYRGFYEEIAQKKNVKLVPTETSTFELIRHAQAVATVTGTVGWEALLRGKPVLIFGYIFYMYCDGVFRIRDSTTAREAFNKIQNGYLPDKQKVLDYLWVMDQVSVLCYLSKRFKSGISLTDKENSEIILQEYLRLISEA